MRSITAIVLCEYLGGTIKCKAWREKVRKHGDIIIDRNIWAWRYFTVAGSCSVGDVFLLYHNASIMVATAVKSFNSGAWFLRNTNLLTNIKTLVILCTNWIILSVIFVRRILIVPLVHQTFSVSTSVQGGFSSAINRHINAADQIITLMFC